MERLGLIKSEKMNSYELEKGYASYRTIVEYFVGDLILCNKISEVDESIWNNMEFDLEIEIFQYYICNVSEWEKEQAKKVGLLFTYSDLLECDVLCVDHFGTSWDIVLTDAKLFDDYEELKKWENEVE